MVAENGKGEFKVVAGPANMTFDLEFAPLPGAGSSAIHLTTFTTDADGKASGTFQMSPGTYSGYFHATNTDKTRFISAGYCTDAGSFDKHSFVRSSQVTVGQETQFTQGTDPLAWGQVKVTMGADDHPTGTLELHGAAPNKKYQWNSGEQSCAYSGGNFTTDKDGNASVAIDLFGTCGGNIHVFDDNARQFQTGFVVKK